MDRDARVLARMKLEVSGGVAYFPGFMPEALSVTCTASRDVDQLAAIADGARFFSRPDEGEKSGPDARIYLLRIALGEQSRALTVANPINDKELARFIQVMSALAAEQRA